MLTACWCPMLFLLPVFNVLGFPVFFSVPVSLDFFRVFFLYHQSICTNLFGPLFLTLDELQTLDWLWYPLSCGLRSEVRRAWIRNLCTGRGLNLGPLAWRKPLDHGTPLIVGGIGTF